MISFLSLIRDKNLADCFTELTFATGFSRYGILTSTGSTLTIRDVYDLSQHAAVLGGPGAGKTTSLQRIGQFAYGDWETGQGGVPLLVRFRDLKSGASLVSHLLAELAVYVRIPDGMPPQHSYHWKLRTLIEVLERISAVLLLDGFDEIQPDLRPGVESEIRDIVGAASGVRLYITCRVAEYKMPFVGVHAYTIAPLSAKQIATFAVRWLGEERAPRFCEVVAAAPYAGTEVVPLMLAHLCALYERHGRLPERPLEVYEQIVSLLIESWDRQRGIIRHSKYADFYPSKKQRFLQAIAYELTQMGRRGSFHDHDLVTAYNLVANKFELPRESAREVVDEIESHTGLVNKSGNGRFDFFHSTIQEYLAAMHAHLLPDVTPLLYPACPNELALVVAGSHDIAEYLQRLLAVLLESGGSVVTRDLFMNVFLVRLLEEHPPFRASAELGWTVLSLLSLTLKADSSEVGWHSESIHSGFTHHPKIRNSIEMGMHPIHNAPSESTTIEPIGFAAHSVRRVTLKDIRIDPKHIEFLLVFLGFKTNMATVTRL